MPRFLEAFALRPLYHPRPRLTKRRVVAAAQLIDTILSTDATLRAQGADFKEAYEASGRDSWKDPQVARLYIELSRALFQSGRISWAEYVFYASTWIEGVHEGRHMEGEYDAEIDPLLRAMDEAEALDPVDEGRYEELSQAYESALDAKFGQTSVEFGANDIEQLQRTETGRVQRVAGARPSFSPPWRSA